MRDASFGKSPQKYVEFIWLILKTLEKEKVLDQNIMDQLEFWRIKFAESTLGFTWILCNLTESCSLKKQEVTEFFEYFTKIYNIYKGLKQQKYPIGVNRTTKNSNHIIYKKLNEINAEKNHKNILIFHCVSNYWEIKSHLSKNKLINDDMGVENHQEIRYLLNSENFEKASVYLMNRHFVQTKPLKQK